MDVRIEKLEHAAADIADVIADLREEDLGEERDWMEIARGEIGVREIAGPLHSPRVLEYLRTTTLRRRAASQDETPWCAAFINWCFSQNGIEGTNSAMARSWLGWGIELDEPRVGCVVIFKRGAPPKGHVALFESIDGGAIRVLGGNQQNAVNIAPRAAVDVLGYRWPPDQSSA